VTQPALGPSSCSGLPMPRLPRLNGHMPALTRRRHPERPDCWHVTMAMCKSARLRSNRDCRSAPSNGDGTAAFVPPSHRGRDLAGYSSSFGQARDAFEAAWKDYLTRCTPPDLDDYRRQCAWTGWKYAMHDVDLRLPTKFTEGRARCFCGATIDIQGTATHVYAADMMAPHHA
jgi:hypothetical protein